jgi:hypothetical protein
MFNVFIEYNRQIAEFQVVLTFLATAIEVLLAFLLMGAIVSSAVGGNNLESGEPLVIIESVDSAPVADKDQRQELVIPAVPNTLAELKASLIELGITGVSKLRKAELEQIWLNYWKENEISQYA